MAAAEYRFLPWTRRGLAAEVKGDDEPTASLPERAAVSVGLTVTGAGAVPPLPLTLYGPGDVLGIDPRLIVRTDPRPNASDVEPNYLPAIEFDPPDLPWMFTPAAPGNNQRLRPWVVLVCVDTAVVDAPHMTTTGGTRGPLPVIELDSAAVATELPDLAESWAWAHAQVATDDSAGAVTPASLAAEPTLNVSRLLCPRRLLPGRRYAACVVPAFDAGVRRGLTGAPPNPAGAQPPPLGPAWDIDAPADVVLPVYFHWEFATGPAGDFEELARKLVPFACPPTVGFAPMHVGDAGSDLPQIAAGQPGARLDMDGALRAPIRDPGTLAEVAAGLRQGLRRSLNAAADHADGSASDETPVLGPPLYGEWHVRRHRVPPGDEGWFIEANLDPRGRVAAGLATEVVRRNQEDLMHAAWEQVGRVQEANALLTWGRLAIEVGRRWHERHLEPLPVHRLTQLAAPLATRVMLGDETVRAAVTATSLPDAAADPALRRFTGGRHRLVRHAAGPAAERPAAVSSTMYAALAAGEVTVDPNVFDRDGLVELAALADVEIPATGQAPIDLAATGLPLAVSADVLRNGRTRFRAVATSLAGVREGMTAPAVRVREDLRTTGLFTKEHLREIVEAPFRGGTVLEAGTLHIVLEAVREAAATNPRAVAFHVQTGGARPVVRALDVDGRGNILVRGPGETSAVRVGRLAGPASGVQLSRIREGLGNLPPGTLPPVGTRELRELRELPTIDVAADDPILRPPSGPIIRPPTGPVTGPVVRPPTGPVVGPPAGPVTGPVGPVVRPPTGPVVGPPAGPGGPVEPRPPVPPTQTVPAPIRDVAVLSRYEAAFADVRERLGEVPPVPERRVVRFPVAEAATAVLSATDPTQTVPRRLATMLTVGTISLLDAVDRKLEVATTVDRVLAYPELPIPTYELLARYDPDRFVPGIGILPPNAITLLETNPRFVEAFLLGLNHELNRELLWREYPTDRRGTPLRHFWAWADGGADIPPIHEWPVVRVLGRNTRGGGEGQLVLLVRGDLLRRYPNTVVVAWRAAGDELKEPPAAGDVVHHVFDGWFPPDVTFFGFPLTEDDLADGWFFVLMEQPTEPRFGFDEGEAGSLTSWLSATWAHTGTEPGNHLTVTGNPLAGRSIGDVTFGRNAGHLAAVTLQRPARVAVDAHDIVAPG